MDFSGQASVAATKETKSDQEGREAQIMELERRIDNVYAETLKLEESRRHWRQRWDSEPQLRALHEESPQSFYKELNRALDSRYMQEQELIERLRVLRGVEAGFQGWQIGVDRGLSDLHVADGIRAFFESRPTPSEDGQILTLPDGVSWMGNIDLPNSMLIRECYKELFDIMAGAIRQHRRRKFVVTGTPGIGKSFFAYYWMYKRMDERKAFLFEKGDSRTCYYWRPGERLVKGPRELFEKVLYQEDFLYLLDTREDLRVSPPCTVVMFSSPREENFHDFRKNSATLLWMPLWTQRELELARRKIYGDKGISESRLNAILLVYGPIPRCIFDYSFSVMDFAKWSEDEAREGKISLQSTGRLEEAVARIDVLSLLNFRPCDAEEGKKEYGYQLVHIDTENYRSYHCQWASDFAFNTLLQRHRESMITLAKKLIFSTEALGELGSLRGHTFEKMCHLILPSGCEHYSLRPLSMDYGDTLPHIWCEKSTMARFKQMEKIKVFVTGIYYRPQNKRFPSADSFILSRDHLFIFQMTAATTKRRSVMHSGLEDLVKTVKERGFPMLQSVSLIFVVPAGRGDIIQSKVPYEMSGGEYVEFVTFEPAVTQYVLTIEEEAFDKVDPENLLIL